MTTRRVYTKEFKREAIRLAEERGNKTAVARELGIHPSLLRDWFRQIRDEGDRAFPGHGQTGEDEVQALRRRLRQVEEENAILKKAVGIFSKRPR